MNFPLSPQTEVGLLLKHILVECRKFVEKIQLEMSETGIMSENHGPSWWGQRQGGFQ